MTAHIVGTNNASPLHDGETISSVPSVSGDGHYVVFAGEYQQQVTLADPNNADHQVLITTDAHETFLYNSRTDTTTLLSGNGDAPVISADGHYVALAATVYVWPETSDQPIQESVINVIDRTTGLTVDQIAISADQSMSADAGVHDPSLSADGKFITFWTTASSLDIDIGTQHNHFDLNNAGGSAQVYRLDLSDPGAAPQLVSASGGVAGNGNSGALFVSSGPAITTVGNVDYTFASDDFQVGDQSASVFIAALPTHGALFLNNVQLSAADVAGSGKEILLSAIDSGALVYKPGATASADAAGYGSFDFHASNGGEPSTMTVNIGHDDQWASSISADGRFVVFESNATNLPGDVNNHSNVYLFDAFNDTVTRVSSDLPNGTTFDPTKFGDSLRPHISSDGRYITFVSFAADLIAGKTINNTDVAQTYVYDTATGQTTLVSGTNGNVAGGDSQWGTSVNGGAIFDAFGSTATDLGGPFLCVHQYCVAGRWDGDEADWTVDLRRQCGRRSDGHDYGFGRQFEFADDRHSARWYQPHRQRQRATDDQRVAQRGQHLLADRIQLHAWRRRPYPDPDGYGSAWRCGVTERHSHKPRHRTDTGCGHGQYSGFRPFARHPRAGSGQPGAVGLDDLGDRAIHGYFNRPQP